MNYKLHELQSLLESVLDTNICFELQSKYQPMIDNIVSNIHADIAAIKDEILVEQQEGLDNQ